MREETTIHHFAIKGREVVMTVHQYGDDCDVNAELALRHCVDVGIIDLEYVLATGGGFYLHHEVDGCTRQVNCGSVESIKLAS